MAPYATHKVVIDTWNIDWRIVVARVYAHTERGGQALPPEADKQYTFKLTHEGLEYDCSYRYLVHQGQDNTRPRGFWPHSAFREMDEVSELIVDKINNDDRREGGQVFEHSYSEDGSSVFTSQETSPSQTVQTSQASSTTRTYEKEYYTAGQ